MSFMNAKEARPVDDPKALVPFGWAPGGYHCAACSMCGEAHSGSDKRSARCQGCAEALRDKRFTEPAPTTRETADHAELATNEKLRQLSAWNSYVESKPAQQRAHQKVKYAVEKGRLIVPEVCSECDQHAGYAKDGRRLLQAHHDDYSKPLDVRWLCIPCHRAITPVNPHRGSSAVTAEIMEEDAIYIRSSCRSHIELSEMFGVDHSAIRQVRRGATWAHVPTYENLLSEIAALRGERTFLMEQNEGAEDAIFDALTRATQAERQRDELRKALEPFAKAAGKLDGLWSEDDWRWNDSVRSGVTVRDIRRASKALANQGADQ